MKPRTQTVSLKTAWFLTAGLLCTLGSLSLAGPQSKGQPQVPGHKAFANPDEAVQALVHAAETNDVNALLEILGPDARDLITSEDAVEDKNRTARFVELAHAKTTVTTDSAHHRAEMIIGPDEWPLPIPIVKKADKWYFDSKAGRTEILLRRVGENELNAIQICRGFVEAQHEYAATKHDGAHLNQYAQRIIGTPGKQDGLAWKNEDGTWGGPVSEAVAKAVEQGYSANQPFHGYYFKVLRGQGPAAPLGQLDFVVGGAMIGGFALVAAPAQYRVTGVQTFIVSHDGVVYQKDLGAETVSLFRSMDRFNPDKTWRMTNTGI